MSTSEYKLDQTEYKLTLAKDLIMFLLVTIVYDKYTDISEHIARAENVLCSWNERIEKLTETKKNELIEKYCEENNDATFDESKIIVDIHTLESKTSRNDFINEIRSLTLFGLKSMSNIS